VAISTHGTVMTLLVARANNLDPFTFWSQLELPSFIVLKLPGYELVSEIEAVGDE
jgi:broad specificity phosphatase PhoE